MSLPTKSLGATNTVGWVRLAPDAGVLRLRFVGRSG